MENTTRRLRITGDRAEIRTPISGSVKYEVAMMGFDSFGTD
jgi:hypothetical protein